MDQKLLDALNNLGQALEEIASALRSKSNDNSSATSDALKGGDFVKQIKEIHVGVQELAKDTKKILKNQETIIALSKKSSAGKKTDIERVGGDKKRESDMKRGIGTILLIAVAVLAIGIAFKLVGGINFLTVIGLSFALLVLSNAFAKIAALKLTLKEAAITSAAMVLMAVALTASSWIMSKIKPIGITQALTAILIGVGFSALSPAINKIIKGFGGMGWGGVIKASFGLVIVLPAIAMGITLSSWIMSKIKPIGIAQALTLILIGAGFSALSPAINKIIKAFSGMSWGGVIKAAIGLVLVLPAIAIGMTLSSWIMSKIKPISFSQGITAILIGAVFAVVSFGIKKLLRAFGGTGIFALMKAIVFLPLVMPAIALGIALASHVLQKTQPIGLSQAWGAIMVAFVFTVVSFGLKKIVQAVGKVKDPSRIALIPLLLPAMAVAIWLSSIALSKVQMMSFGQFLVSLGISILFIAFAFALKLMSKVIKKLSPKDVLLIPLLMTTMSMAVWASSHILKKTADIPFMMMLKILVFSIVFAIAVIVLAAVAWIIGKYFGVKNVLKGSVAIVALAGVVMMSSNLVAQGDYSKYPGWKWSLMTGLSLAVFGVVAWGLMKLPGGGVVNIIKGSAAILVLAATIMASSHILSVGNYGKYPKVDWAKGVGLSLAVFGAAAWLLGLSVFGPQALIFGAGLAAIAGVAGAIVVASKILTKGDYKSNYPNKRWAEGVAIALGAFSPIYGMLMKNAIFKMFGGGGVGPNDFAKAILTVTRGIVTAAKEFADPKNKGIWKKAPTKEWAIGVAIALEAFSPIYGMLMKNAIFKMLGSGGVGPSDFAKAIVTVTRGIVTAAQEFASPKNKGVWKKAPTKEWAEGVAISLDAFSPIYSMLLTNGIFKMLGGGGVGPDEFSKAIVTVSKGIISAAVVFADPKNKGTWKGGPTKEWAEGVGIAMGAFAPVYKMMVTGGIFKAFGVGGVGPEGFAKGVKTVSRGIIAAAEIFAKSKVTYSKGTYPSVEWGKGVGAALAAFAPLFRALSNDTGWFTDGDEVIRNMKKGVVMLAESIVTVGWKFTDAKGIDWNAYPSQKWGYNVGKAMKSWTGAIDRLRSYDVSSAWKARAAAKSMISLARVVSKDSKMFKVVMDTKFVTSLAPNVETFTDLLQMINSRTGFLGASVGLVKKVVLGIVDAARTVSRNSKIFNTKMDSNFMKSLSSNILYYMKIIGSIDKTKSGLSAFGGRNSGDPIMNMAKGMVSLAQAYDKLSASILKMSQAMSNFNEKKISQLERLSRLRPPGGYSGGVQTQFVQTQSAQQQGGSQQSGASVNVSSAAAAKKEKGPAAPQKGKYGDIYKQNDTIIDLLKDMNKMLGDGSNLDTSLMKYLGKKSKSSFDGS